MITSAKRGSWKKRIIYFYFPVVLATLALSSTDLGSEKSLVDVLGVYAILFVFSFAICALVDALLFHAFDLFRWLAKGMKQSQ